MAQDAASGGTGPGMILLLLVLAALLAALPCVALWLWWSEPPAEREARRQQDRARRREERAQRQQTRRDRAERRRPAPCPHTRKRYTGSRWPLVSDWTCEDCGYTYVAPPRYDPRR